MNPVDHVVSYHGLLVGCENENSTSPSCLPFNIGLQPGSDCHTDQEHTQNYERGDAEWSRDEETQGH